MICIVYNADGIPVNFPTPEDAIVMALTGKVLVLENHEKVYRSQHLTIPVPKRMILREYVKLPPHFYGHARLTSRALKIRDKGQCQYCGRKRLDADEFWTRDHVFPVSRGGKNVWTNVVLSCSSCNNKKDSRTPAEARMELIKEPHAPTRWELDALSRQSRN